MYGERDEPYTAFSRLGERLESTLDSDAVLPAIATTVREALRLSYAAATINAELQAEIRLAIGEVRRLVYDLRPPTLDELGLAEAVRQRAARYNASEEN